MRRSLLPLFLLVWFSHGYAQVEFTSSNLPIIVIDTEGQDIVDEPKIAAHMGIIDNGSGNRNNVDDPFNNYDGRIGIEIRGSSSQSFPKKQYGLELRDESGDGIDAPLLGLPEEEDWVLFAPYNDKSLMRDVLAYTLASKEGRYAPRTRYCELVLNGEYMGVYVLIEKIKRDKNRVDINKLNPDEIDGNNLTGGYILKIDKIDPDESGWNSNYLPPNRASNQHIVFIYDTPNSEDIVAEQKQYIQSFMKDFENALAGDDFKDPDIGYAKYIDVGSFIDYFIMNELSKNVDGYRISTFMHKQRDSDGGKLHMGPVWDYNLGFGNADYCTNGNTYGFVMDFNNICSNDSWLVPFWWQRLLDDPAYQQQLNTRWEALRAGPLSKNEIHNVIDSIATLLNQEAQQRNFTRWPVLGQYVWPNYFVGNTFQEEVNWLKSWIDFRIDWLDENIPRLIVSNEPGAKTDNLFAAYPNPFSERLNIKFGSARDGVKFQLMDAMGRIARVVDGSHVNDETQILNFDTSDLPAGLYLLRASYGNQREMIKLIKR